MSKVVDNVLEELMGEVDAYLDAIGVEAVEIAKVNGNYKNHTGRLRRSNYHRVRNHTLEFGNSAPYASKVSSRGYDVIDSAVSYLRKKAE